MICHKLLPKVKLYPCKISKYKTIKGRWSMLGRGRIEGQCHVWSRVISLLFSCLVSQLCYWSCYLAYFYWYLCQTNLFGRFQESKKENKFKKTFGNGPVVLNGPRGKAWAGKGMEREEIDVTWSHYAQKENKISFCFMDWNWVCSGLHRYWFSKFQLNFGDQIKGQPQRTIIKDNISHCSLNFDTSDIMILFLKK